MATNTYQGSNLLVFVCFAGAMALWGSAFIATKVALNDIPPFALIFLRLVLGSVFFLAFWRVGFREVVASKDRWLLLLMSGFEPCLYFLFETKALMYTTASQAGVVFAFLPILILVFSYVLHREKPGLAQVIGGVIAVVGVIILCLSGSPSADASSPAFGNFLELLAMASAAVYTVLLKRLSGTYSPFFLAAVQSFTGAIFFLPFGLYDLARGVTISTASAIAVVYLGLIVTAGAYTLFNIGISKASVAQGAMYFNLVPIFAIIFSMAFLGETISLAQLASMALVVLGVLLGLAPSRQRAIEAA